MEVELLLSVLTIYFILFLYLLIYQFHIFSKYIFSSLFLG